MKRSVGKYGRAFLKIHIKMLYKTWLSSLKKVIDNMNFWQLVIQSKKGDPDAKALAKKRLETFMPPRRKYIGLDDQDVEI